MSRASAVAQRIFHDETKKNRYFSGPEKENPHIREEEAFKSPLKKPVDYFSSSFEKCLFLEILTKLISNKQLRRYES